MPTHSSGIHKDWHIVDGCIKPVGYTHDFHPQDHYQFFAERLEGMKEAIACIREGIPILFSPTGDYLTAKTALNTIQDGEAKIRREVADIVYFTDPTQRESHGISTHQWRVGPRIALLLTRIRSVERESWTIRNNPEDEAIANFLTNIEDILPKIDQAIKDLETSRKRELAAEESLRAKMEESLKPKAEPLPTSATEVKATTTRKSDGEKKPQARRKRGQGRSDSEVKIIGELTRHHQYNTNTGCCSNFDAIGVRALAKAACVSKASVDRFFKKKFGEPGVNAYKRYKLACSQGTTIEASLKLFNDHYAPREFFNRLQADEQADE